MGDRNQRLSNFAVSRHLEIIQNPARKQIPGQAATFRTAQDEETVRERIRNARVSRRESRRISWLTTKPDRLKLTPKEISIELISAVQANDSPGIVEVLRDLLIEVNGDINYVRQKGRIRSAKNDSQLLEIAVSKGNIDLVQLLVEGSNQAGLDTALSSALSRPIFMSQLYQNQIAIVELLLAHGADAVAQNEAFQTAMTSQNTNLVTLLLNAPRPISNETISANLLTAVQLGSLELVWTLVLANAAGSGVDGNGDALKETIRLGRWDLLECLMLCSSPPSVDILDQGVSMAFSLETNAPLLQKTMINILLDNGAQGPHSDLTLVQVTRDCASSTDLEIHSIWEDMMRLLVNHGASINFQNAAALKICVSNIRIDLLDILLGANHLDSTFASEALATMNPNASSEQRIEITSKLMKNGATGTSLDKALVDAVAADDSKMIQLLMSSDAQNKASVDYNNAQALQDAVQREKLLIVKTLLAAGPTQQSLAYAFPHIRRASKDERLLMTQEFLDAGARGIEITRGLDAAVADHSPTRDPRLVQMLVRGGAVVDKHINIAAVDEDDIFLEILLAGNPPEPILSQSILDVFRIPDQGKRISIIKLLLNAGANINFQNGTIILAAVIATDGAALDALFQSSHPQPKSLVAAFATATAIEDQTARYSLCQILLSAGAIGREVDEGLVLAVTTQPQNTDFLELLIPKASVNYNDGVALCLAIRNTLYEHTSRLLTLRPNAVTLQNAFEEVLALENEAMQLEFCSMFLQASPGRDLISIALTMAIKAQNYEISRLLLQNGASVDFNNGASILTAISIMDARLLKLLINEAPKKPSSDIISAAFEATILLRDGTVKDDILDTILKAGVRKETLSQNLVQILKSKQPHLPAIVSLLKNGASIYYDNNQSLLLAAKGANTEIFESLLQYANDTSAISSVFSDRLSDEGFWTTQNGLKIMEMLLKKGASGQSVNEALIIAVLRLGVELLAHEFATLLLDNGADVNYGNGFALQEAVKIRASAVVLDILKRDCNSTTLSRAFPYILSSGLPEQDVLDLASQFALHRNQNFKNAAPHPDLSEDIIIHCMRYFPSSDAALGVVLSAGFPVDGSIKRRRSSQSQRNTNTPLFWALVNREPVISDAVITCLISAGARLHSHLEPLLHLTIKTRRPWIALFLISRNVDVNICDRENRSPLVQCIRYGDMTTMTALLAADAKKDDDALHMAVQRLRTEAIHPLIDHGYDVNKISLILNGRTPLAELCLKSPGFLQHVGEKITESKAKQVVQALISKGARVDVRIPNKPGGRSILYHALDSVEPYIMTKALLECCEFGYINKDFNLFVSNGHTYSAYCYVEYGLCASDKSHHPSLLKLLEGHNGEPRFWKNEGKQIHPAVNPPEEIKQRITRDKAIEDEYNERLRLQELEKELKKRQMLDELERANLKHQVTMSHLEEQRARELRHKTEGYRLDQAAMDRRHASETNQLAVQRQHSQSMGKMQLDFGSQRNAQYAAHVAMRRDEDQSELKLIQARDKLGKTAIAVAAAQTQYNQRNGIQPGQRNPLAHRPSTRLLGNGGGHVTEIS